MATVYKNHAKDKPRFTVIQWSQILTINTAFINGTYLQI